MILHISDIHLNPIGLRLARQLAAEVGADAVIDTGDTTSFGLEFEGGFADLIKDFDIPYYWVAGNHDSKEVREAIARSAGVTPLDDRAVRIGALTVSGVDDPTFTALERPGVEEWAKEYRAADDRTVEIVESNRPDLLAVHNPVQAAPILGLVDTVIAGHTHRFSVGDKDGTTVEVVASSGATGLGSLLVEDDLPYGFSILRYDGDVLIAIDQAEFDGLDDELNRLDDEIRRCWKAKKVHRRSTKTAPRRRCPRPAHPRPPAQPLRPPALQPPPRDDDRRGPGYIRQRHREPGATMAGPALAPLAPTATPEVVTDESTELDPGQHAHIVKTEPGEIAAAKVLEALRQRNTDSQQPSGEATPHL